MLYKRNMFYYKVIILDTNSIILNKNFIVSDAKLIICNANLQRIL